LQKCCRINRRRLMSQRRFTGQQVVGDADPLLDCAGRQMENELPHPQPALHSRRAQQFAEAGLKIATDTAGMLGGFILIGERGV
jgi:hypothetical protein